TTFYMVVGLVQSDKGKIFIDDDDLTLDPMHLRARKGIGYLPQEPKLDPNQTVREAVEEAVAEAKNALVRLDEVYALYAE
ncbi:ATP-binding cassette domain-containing protein, partial [Shewanella sp. MBTL60-112-B1]|uniref:ATP-binding cassette domain-containing protein n=1 Tax=Shewanella sp. MBTL60-112-B1 TaxID=2815916 RepID=UPI00217FE888